MSVSTQDYAMLSSLAYEGLRDNELYTDGASTYKVVMTSSTPDGYRGALFKNVTTHELVLANAGTYPLSIRDLWSDGEMAARLLPDQYVDASNLMARAMDYADAQGIDSITTTGHSLGGSLAQLLAMTFDIHAETFNPYGTYDIAKKLGLSPDSVGELIVNNREALDPISHASRQVGESREYLTKADFAVVDKIESNERVANLQLTYDFLKQVAAAHSMSNFWNEDQGGPGELLEHNYWPDATTLHTGLSEDIRPIREGLSGIGNRWAISVEDGYKAFWDSFFDSISFLRARHDVSSSFTTFSRYPQRADPFALDLDDDGLETVGTDASNPVMFDINASGVKQAVGWVLPDDGFLALDRNNNGTIDSGAELFGDAMVLPDGTKAQDGFAAVASLDTDGDGVVDGKDDQWAQLRVWQDLNQDGVSQPNELKGMAAVGIASISVNKTEHETVLDNGNALADLGSFTRSDGTEGTAGTVGQLADVDLSVDTFDSQFTDSIPISDQAADLPDLQGSGQVRDLRQAASMDTDAGRALASILAQYNGATTRDAQLALLDDVIKAWSDTSTMATTFTGAYAGHDLTVDMQSWYAGAGFTEGGADYEHWADILSTMERFNGRTYQSVPDGSSAVTLTLWHTPRDLLQKSYDALKQEVYDGLLLKTLLKPYMDAIQLRMSDSGTVGFDFTGTDDLFQARYVQAPTEVVRDLLDLQRLNGPNLTGAGWNGYDPLRNWIHDAATNPDHDAATRSQLLSEIQAGTAWFGGAGRHRHPAHRRHSGTHYRRHERQRGNHHRQAAGH